MPHEVLKTPMMRSGEVVVVLACSCGAHSNYPWPQDVDLIVAWEITHVTKDQAREIRDKLNQDCQAVLAKNKAVVILFKPSGKYYTQEEWRIPDGAIGPHDMVKSPDYRTISGGPVLVETQEPWGFPCLLILDELQVLHE